MKNIASFQVMIILLILSQNIFAQSGERIKKDQTQLANEIHVSYGLASVYLFTNGIRHNFDGYYDGDAGLIHSNGAVLLGYNRLLNKVIMTGFEFSFQNIWYDRTYSDYQNYSISDLKERCYENLISGLAKVTFNYINRPVIRMYSGIGIGVSIDYSKITPQGEQTTKDRKILPAAQLTLMGLRFGRQVGGFIEFGVGTNAIITGGLSVQIGDE